MTSFLLSTYKLLRSIFSKGGSLCQSRILMIDRSVHPLIRYLPDKAISVLVGRVKGPSSHYHHFWIRVEPYMSTFSMKFLKGDGSRDFSSMNLRKSFKKQDFSFGSCKSGGERTILPALTRLALDGCGNDIRQKEDHGNFTLSLLNKQDKGSRYSASMDLRRWRSTKLRTTILYAWRNGGQAG